MWGDTSLRRMETSKGALHGRFHYEGTRLRELDVHLDPYAKRRAGEVNWGASAGSFRIRTGYLPTASSSA